MSEGKKLALSIVILIGTLVAFGVWLFLGIREQGRLEDSLTQKRDERQELRGKVAQLPSLRQEKQKLQGELHEYETILPKDRELDKIFDTITEFEGESSVRILSVSPKREARDTGKPATTSYKKVSYRVDVIGDFFQIAQFVNLLENWDRFVQVDSFNIKSKDEDTLINEATLMVSTFVYDPKAKLAQTKARATTSAPKETSGVPFSVKEALAGRYVFNRDKHGKHRRDPFSNPLTRKQTASSGKRTGAPVARKTMTPEHEIRLCEHVEQRLAEMERLLQRGDYDKAAEIYWDVQDGLARRYDDRNARRRVLRSRRKAGRLEVMLKEAKGEQLYKLIQGHYAQMEKFFESQAYEEVQKLYETVQEVVKKADEDFVHERLPDLLASCGKLSKRAGTHKEFEQIGIEIQGTFWSGGRGHDRRAAVIINGQTLVEGERLKADAVKGRKGARKGVSDLDAEIIVKKIEREKVTFLYKNELIEKLQFEDS